MKESDKRLFRETLLSWYRNNQRKLPWRTNKFPYNIWVSEIMLQQTQVKTVVDYYNRFIQELPTIDSLAKCPEEKLLKLWEGLGYYNRVFNMQKASRKIIDVHSGSFPSDYGTILELPGIGKYTASAISSIAFDQPYAVLDGNVKRVIARMMSYRDPINKPSSEKILWEIADDLLERNSPGDYNQAIMELGAEICKPKVTECANCPIRSYCKAFELNIVAELPVKLKKKKTPESKQVVAVIVNQEKQVLLFKRPVDGMLKGMWELPNVTLNGKRGAKDELEQFIKRTFNFSFNFSQFTGPYKHQYSHFTLLSDVYISHVSNGINLSSLKNSLSGDFVWYKLQEDNEVAVHRAHSKILNKLKSVLPEQESD